MAPRHINQGPSYHISKTHCHIPGLLAFLWLCLGTCHIASANTQSTIPLSTCGKGITSKGKRLLSVSRIRNFQQMKAALNWASNQPWLQQFNFQPAIRGLGFLQNRMVRALGIKWSDGVWVSVYDHPTSSKTRTTPYSWLPTQQLASSRARIDWKRVTQTLDRLEVTVEIKLGRSFWLNFAIKQLLSFSGLTYVHELRNNDRIYWVKSRTDIGAVIVVGYSRLLMRLVWDISQLQDEAQRDRLWRTYVSNTSSQHQSKSFLKAKQQLLSSFPQATQGSLYLLPQHLCRMLQPLPFPFKKHVMQTLASYKGYAIGGQVQPYNLKGHELVWPSRTRKVQATKPPPVAKWLSSSTQWVSSMLGSQRHVANLLTLLSYQRPRGNQSARFLVDFKKQLAAELSRRGWAPGAVSLWQDMWLAQWMAELLFKKVMFWVESPAPTTGKQTIPKGSLAFGQLTPLAKELLSVILPRIPKMTTVQIYGQAPLYIYPLTKTRSIVWTLQKKRWWMATHPDLIRRLLRDANQPPPSGLMQLMPTASLLQLQGWNDKWSILHINPSQMACSWQPNLRDDVIKRVAQIVEHMEVAHLELPKRQQTNYRITWKQGRSLLSQKTFGPCWPRSTWWQMMSQLAWSIPLQSPVVRLVEPLAYQLIARYIQTRKRATKPTQAPTKDQSTTSKDK